LAGDQALYLQLNMVADAEDESLDAFARRVGERTAANSYRAIVLDLRLNHGGNGALRTRLVRALIRAEDGDTRLFVLTSRGTFSASQFILDDLDRLTDALFIGEPAGSRPSSYGDSYRSLMPNSRISVRSSIVWWQDGQNDAPWTWIDVATPLTFADYVRGHDPALAAALAFRPEPPLIERLVTAAKTGGPKASLAAFERWRNDPAHWYADVALAAAAGAEGLLQQGFTDGALELAVLGTRLYPERVEPWLLLAIGSDVAGHQGDALTAARRVLVLDPNNRSIQPLIDKLK
jgi:hypothetical protein